MAQREYVSDSFGVWQVEATKSNMSDICITVLPDDIWSLWPFNKWAIWPEEQ